MAASLFHPLFLFPLLFFPIRGFFAIAFQFKRLCFADGLDKPGNCCAGNVACFRANPALEKHRG